MPLSLRVGVAAACLFLALPASAAKAKAKPKAPSKAAPAEAPPAAPAPDPMTLRMKSLRDEIDGLQNALTPKIDELKRLGDTYAVVPDPETLFARREPLVKEIGDGLRQYESMEDEFNNLRTGVDANSVATMINAFVSGKGLPAGMEGAYFQYNDALEYGRQMRGFRESTLRAMNAEEVQYKAARHAQAVQKRWVLATSAGGTVLLVIIVALLYWRRQQARTAIVITGPAGQPMIVTAENAPGPVLPSPAPVPQLPPPSEAAPGTVLGGNYRVERVLGRGGMGVVYEAVDMTLQRRVAIKRMTDDLLKSGAELELLVNEARMVAQLKHPNIVEIHSIVRESGLLHLVFEYVDGKPLSAYLERGQRLALRSVKGIVRQTAAALDYAHSRKVVHRDLKPSNIMVGQGGVVKVMDFGIAHQAKMTVAKLTRTGAWGTPPYMAPEQELGQVGRETDVFALGVCVYEMVTGRLPFLGPNFLAQKRERIYPRPTQVVAGLPAALDAVVAKALEPDVRQRFSSAPALSAALDGVQE